MPRREVTVALDLDVVRQNFGFSAAEFPNSASSEVLSAKLQSALDAAAATRAGRPPASPGGRGILDNDDSYDLAWLTPQERAALASAGTDVEPGQIVRE